MVALPLAMAFGLHPDHAASRNLLRHLTGFLISLRAVLKLKFGGPTGAFVW